MRDTFDTPGVKEESTTETFFRFTAYLKSKNWKGVPFHVEAGKSMSKRSVTIEVLFKDVDVRPF